MSAVSEVTQDQAIQAVTPSTTEADQSETSSESSFEVTLKALLTPNSKNEINEEELFASLIHERLSALKGEEVAKKYDDLLAKKKDALRRPDGNTYVEDAARAALKTLREDGTLTAEEANKVHTEAFSGAQLDDNKNALYDGIGGANDPTKSVALLDSALGIAKIAIDKLTTSGSSDLSASGIKGIDEFGMDAKRSGSAGSGSTAVGQNLDGANGFLFKPEGDHSKKLVILLPPDLAGDVAKLLLKDSEGNVVEEGQYSGNGNGGRDHFRYNKAGSQYPANLTVEAKLKNGEVKSWNIADPSQRYE